MNPFFQAMGGNRQPNMMQQFQSFMQQMRGKDPNAMIQEMVSSGRISQDQLNQVQKQASLPLRGAWIEIRAGRSVGCEVIVAHREGSADGNSMSADRICLALRKSA